MAASAAATAAMEGSSTDDCVELRRVVAVFCAPSECRRAVRPPGKPKPLGVAAAGVAPSGCGAAPPAGGSDAAGCGGARSGRGAAAPRAACGCDTPSCGGGGSGGAAAAANGLGVGGATVC